ncbi:propanediol utilization protein [Sporanaerobium hydrogeniformans]|uniref:Propanediol utilization protein n=1 Tax=Sporanaerobium hydrogeniformans TaxID=3072179 RepID=A0AC61DCI7_9FIRM|nr:BMC domain-containing protein [Sporanaerobium hydrogeniformans]PHV70282.1 propanediol utilization protein [Sporanaerobium hydrogeniformans]
MTLQVEDKQRIIQEFVPGKQITLAHIIANPTGDIYKKLGLITEKISAIGILTITPSEGSIIAADVASKAADIAIGFIDRFSGALIISGDISAVEAAVKEIIEVLEHTLGFTPTHITRT